MSKAIRGTWVNSRLRTGQEHQMGKADHVKFLVWSLAKRFRFWQKRALTKPTEGLAIPPPSS